MTHADSLARAKAYRRDERLRLLQEHHVLIDADDRVHLLDFVTPEAQALGLRIGEAILAFGERAVK